MEQVNWESDIKSWGDGLGNAHSDSAIVNTVIAEVAEGRSLYGKFPADKVLLYDSEIVYSSPKPLINPNILVIMACLDT